MGDKDNFLHIHMCTGRRVTASEHRTRNPTVTSPIHSATLTSCEIKTDFGKRKA